MRRSQFLSVFEANACEEVEQGLDLWQARTHDPLLTLSLMRAARTAAVAGLLWTAESERFAARLQFSGRVLLEHLRTSGGGELGLARCRGVFDAFASGDERLALALARRACTVPPRGRDAPEDSAFVGSFVALASDSIEAFRVCRTAWVEGLQGDADPRLDVLSALHERDGIAVSDALEAWLVAHRAAWTDELLHTPEEIATESAIVVEVLAVLRLSDQLAVAVADDLVGAPPLARRVNVASTLDAPTAFP